MTRLESSVSMHSPVASTISCETWADSYVWTVLSLAWTTCISLKTMFVSYLSREAFPKPSSFPPLSQGKEMINSVSWLASPQMISVTACSLIHHNFLKLSFVSHWKISPVVQEWSSISFTCTHCWFYTQYTLPEAVVTSCVKCTCELFIELLDL